MQREWAVHFVDKLQALKCPVCRDMLELRRSTWEQPELKMQAHSAFQQKHKTCRQTGVRTALVMRDVVDVTVPATVTPERMYELGMAKFCGS